jgi:hypothetical protein
LTPSFPSPSTTALYISTAAFRVGLLAPASRPPASLHPPPGPYRRLTSPRRVSPLCTSRRLHRAWSAFRRIA